MARRSRSADPPPPPPRGAARPARVLVVHCPDWPVVALGEGAEAVAVMEKGRVFATSAAARRFGVARGQRRRDAQSRCPALVARARDEAAERRAFEPVVRALEAFGPPVALGRPGWAALLTRGPARYFGGEGAFAERVGEALEALLGAGAFRVGVADSAFAAGLAARTGALVPSRETATFLSPFPVAVLGDPATADLLGRLGVYTLGEFAGLGERDVLARFGVEGGRLQALARGEEVTPLSPRALTEALVVEVAPDPPITRVDEAAFVVRALAAELAHRLSVGGLACSLLEVAVELSDGGRVVRRWSHEGPFSAVLVAERLRFQLEVFLLGRGEGEEGAREGRGIEGLRLEALEVAADSGRAFELWGTPVHDEERVGRTFARLQGIAGPQAVLRAVLVGGRGPGERVRLVPFGEGLAVGESLAGAPWPGGLPPPSPALLDGRPLGVLDAAGRSVAVNGRGAVTAPPALLLEEGVGCAVVAWSGPWPADEHWWEAARHRRRARIQVLLEDGRALLLSLEQGAWQLEGQYD